MLRLSRRLLEHPGMGTGHPYFIDTAIRRKSRLRRFLGRRWSRFKEQNLFMKGLYLVGYGGCAVLSYALLCVAVHLVHGPSIHAMFHSSASGVAPDTVHHYRILPSGVKADGETEPSAEASRVAELMREEHRTASSKAPLKHVMQHDYTLATWEEIEETLQEGDLILMRGEGWLSWGIVTIQFAYSLMRPPALYYSHAAVVVKPAEYKYAYELEQEEAAAVGRPRGRWYRRAWSSLFGGRGPAASPVEKVLKDETKRLNSAKVKVRGAVLLECMDNTDFNVQDVHGDVKYFSVQQVEATKRLTSTRVSRRGGDVVHGYQYCAVRRLRDQERTAAFKSIIRDYVERNEGRPVEENLFFPLAFFSPRFYLRVNPAREEHNVVCCGEMIAELYEELDLFQRRWRWVRLTDGNGQRVPPDADEVRSVGSRIHLAVADWIGPKPLTGQHLAGRRARDEAVCAALAARGLPPPTDGDLHPTNAVAVPQMRVYERLHSRKDAEAQHPLHSRSRPVAPRYTCIENWGVLADTELQRRSVEGCADLSPETRSALLAEMNRAVTPPPQQQPGTGAAAAPPQAAKEGEEPLVSGMVVRTKDGGTAQLQHYFTHNPMATMPYTWTRSESARVFDWATFARQRFRFGRLDSSLEGQLLLHRAARMGPTATAATTITFADGATTTTTTGLPMLPRPEQIVVVDVDEELAIVDPVRAAEVLKEREEHPGPRLGEEIRMQRPQSMHFHSSAEEDAL